MYLLYILFTLLTWTSSMLKSEDSIDNTIPPQPHTWSNEQTTTTSVSNYSGPWITRAYEAHTKNSLPGIREDYSHVEQQLISDMLSGSVHTKHMNYLLLNVGLDIQCRISSCEKYSGIGVDLMRELDNRGQRLDPYSKSMHPQVNQMNIINAGSSKNDVTVTQLSAFTGIEELTLSIIHDYNMKGNIVIIADNDIVFRKVKKYILESEMFNIYIIRKVTDGNLFLMYETCAFCNSGVTEINLYNSWSTDKGFKDKIKYTSSFKGEFFGAHLKVGLRLQAPVVFVTGKRADGKATYSGSAYMLLQTVADSLNFQIVIKLPEDGKACMDVSTVKLIGFCRMLLRKQVNIAGFAISINSLRFPYLDPTATYNILGRNIYSANTPLESKWTSMGSSADPTVLVLTLVSYLVLVHLYCSIAKYWYNDTTVKYSDTLMTFFAIIWLEGVGLRCLRFVEMLIVGIWLVTCYIVISVIFGEYTSIKSSPVPFRKPIDSIEDMASYKLSWVTHPVYHMDVNLEKKVSMQDLKKGKKLMKTRAALQHVLTNPNSYIYYSVKTVAEPTIRKYFLDADQHRDPFHVSPSVDVPYLLTVLVRKDAPFRDAITQKLLQVNAAALLKQKFLPDSFDMFGKDITVKNQREPFQPITLFNMFIPFTLCLVALMISGLVFILEETVKKIKQIKIEMNDECAKSGQGAKANISMNIEDIELDQVKVKMKMDEVSVESRN